MDAGALLLVRRTKARRRPEAASTMVLTAAKSIKSPRNCQPVRQAHVYTNLAHDDGWLFDNGSVGPTKAKGRGKKTMRVCATALSLGGPFHIGLYLLRSCCCRAS